MGFHDDVAKAAVNRDQQQDQLPLALATHSRFVQRVRRRYEAELPLLSPGLPSREQLSALIDTLAARGRPLTSALRVARQLTLERLASLDIEADAPMPEVARVMTELAEVTLDRALAAALAEQDERYGAPLNEAGERIDFWVVGMGKLGGRELNVSSDIDLIYVYEEDGQTTGRPDGTGRISAHEYFSQVARSLYTQIGETTEDGFVFRVDLALRPNGNSGPPVVSLAMLEEYFLVQGREWERFAWLKSRVVAPRASVASGRALQLRDIVIPFVFRRYLDYGVFESLRSLHSKVREEAQRRAAGRPERANDVKLSRGGIREIEFTVQLLQVVRGGQYPEIRTRSTLKALSRLTAVGVIPPETADRLAAAYTFLRRLEHRIQYLDDQQTHQLPTADGDLGWIARSLGFRCSEDACELLEHLGETREFVALEFDALLHDGQAPKGASKGCKGCSQPVSLDSDSFYERLPAPLAERVRPWAQQARVRGLRDETRQRLAKLILRSAQAAQQDICTIEAAVRFVDWVEPLLRRESYVALLLERQEVHHRLLRLLGLARWPMRYLMRHPGVIDELADPRLIYTRFEPQGFVLELEQRHEAWTRSGQADEEALLDTLRRAHHAEVFRTLVRDVEGHITVEQVADDLSLLADATVDCTMRWAWSHLRQRHVESPRFAVIAYGKLGGKELGYGSDLDVVFLYDDEDERAPEVYAAFARKLIPWLTLRTAAGELFEIDTALRPNGNSGLLVTSLKAFEAYQSGRGSNTAWTWEHQAITRARFCAGDPAIAPAFEAVRRAVIAAPREQAALKAEIRSMRQKVREAHPDKPDRFDVKHSPGAMMDVEFAVQYLVLAHGATHAELHDNVGNIALLQRAEAAGLLPAGVGQAAADAYRELRRAQHRARLDERATHFPPDEWKTQSQAVQRLWHCVFDG
ncbi:bifunctional [glutamate--ammonia ligase]-adenylyl-L-tyrosine phosphorylase/[glutamate--ammonia-ligase] adenylyltransferase [Eleftheria terrae]|uniref:bifunctional [glutamate--ammonia ligase]-adenylyl-L-tyrosine phosphorylase/[glutamate--ammonia-ligase] adenylyltransferase n=1 Tax=Eleftheria terrae TaxID=1597781 RepID=UPI00263B247A|nr:bifunctional [glutamate--ammonia ligase]-adenylyl-L-tyrosine phosphorylase/[glutamate--ammonia-ligase] adenylyltransferase [Eleftheria terrae]WKB50933.1 bifunctional [glutamate--ammonia ligase]-adenylyl-L-tyrosine phosphorylase/[glutamate--ammonia-ligase] adenylyltransferase [Eleftheria terrae]